MLENVLRIAETECLVVAGRFFPDGANAPTYGAGDNHRGWSVAYGGAAGKFIVTFDKTLRVVAFLAPALQLAANADTKVHYGAYDADAGTLVIQLYDPNTGAGTGAVVAAPAADPNVSISFGVIFAKRGVN